MEKSTFQANIYTPDWKFVSVLTDYISIVWTDRYYDLGDFELIVPLNAENLDIFSPDNYIVCNQSDKVMIIEEVSTAVSSDGYKMQVKGHSAEALLKRRVTADEFICNSRTNNELDVFVQKKEGGIAYSKKSHWAGALGACFMECFNNGGAQVMNESESGPSTLYSGDSSRYMPIIRWSGVISDPFNHIADAIGNIDSHGEEYFDIIQKACEDKDIGFAIYRNFERETTGNTRDEEANTPLLFDLVLYDGWNRTGSYLEENGVDMTIQEEENTYYLVNGVIFSVEYLNLSSSDSTYSNENYKNYIYLKGDDVETDSGANVDVAEATANFTKFYSEEDPAYYQVGAPLENEKHIWGTKHDPSGIFRRETFVDSNINRGYNTRNKYARRLKTRAAKELKKNDVKIILSCQIQNVQDYTYRINYNLGDLVLVKDSMNHHEIFRVTEEIISSDAAGLKIYPTLVLYDPDKYVADDTIIDVDDSSRHAVEFKFNGGLANDDLLTNLIMEFLVEHPPSSNPNDWPYDTEPGTIIGVITSTTPWNRGLTTTGDNFNELRKRLTGVITYQIYGDYIGFPSEIGSVSNNPNILGSYNIEKENGSLRYWASGWDKFVAHENTSGDQIGTICTGWATYIAHWSPPYHKITYEHGEEGKFAYYAFSNSYCLITDIEEYSQTAPDFNSGTWYEKKYDWNTDAPQYVRLYSRPYGWSTPNSETYYSHYYTNSEKLDKVFEEVPHGKECNPPSQYAVQAKTADYARDFSVGGYGWRKGWTPDIVTVVEDATYTAAWKSTASSKEDKDEDDDWDDDNPGGQGEVKSPVKHKVQKSVYVGDSEKDIQSETGMATFRLLTSRMFDKFRIQNGSMVKVADGKEQHARFCYTNDIGNGCRLQAHWRPNNGYLPCISIVRNSDEALIAGFDFGSRSAYLSDDYITEASFTVLPSIKKIKGFKALTEHLYSGDSEWPTNTIYSRDNRGNYTAVNSRPANWDAEHLSDGNWRNYYIYDQIGAKYGICCQGSDDLSILFTPVWARLGIIDWPLIPMPYDTKYTANALDIANYINRPQAKHAYTVSGWVWVEIPDGRWYGKKYENSSNALPVEGRPKFVYTDKWLAMYTDSNGRDLIHMPDDWETGDYYYKGISSYTTEKKLISIYYDSITYGPASYMWGPGWNTQGYHSPTTYYDHFEDMYEGSSSAGLSIPLPKMSGSENSVIVTIIGQTKKQHVKPGETATFSVNAISLVLGAKLDYYWEIKYPSSGNWVSYSSGGSSISVVGTSELNGSEFRCLVKASYSLFGETIDGQQYSDTMSFAVDGEGTDGKPSKKKQAKSEDDVEADSAESTSNDGFDPSGKYPTASRKVQNPDGSTTETWWMYVGDEEIDASDYVNQGAQYFMDSDDWIVYDSYTTDRTPSSGPSTTSGGSGGNTSHNLDDDIDSDINNITSDGKVTVEETNNFAEKHGEDAVNNYHSGNAYADYLANTLPELQ